MFTNKEKPPKWPLPLDYKYATAQPATVETGRYWCPNCRMLLAFYPTNKENENRTRYRHTKGLKCKRGSELVRMNQHGFHVVSTEGKGYYDAVLKDLLVKKAFYSYLPAEVVSFIRWQHPDNGRTNRGSKVFHAELVRFLALPQDEQQGVLAGAILEYEFKKEDARNDDPPF